MTEMKLCECGCGADIPLLTKSGKPRRFVVGHNRRKKPSAETISCACGCGEVISRFNKWGRERKFVNHHASGTIKIYDSQAESARAARSRNAKKAAKLWSNRALPATKLVDCIDCGERKPAKRNGHFDAAGHPLYRSRCIDCRSLVESKLNRDYRKRNRKDLNKKARERKRRRKAKAIAYLGGSCLECGYVGKGREMTFHHRSRATKEHSISQIFDRAWSIIQSELDKCDLLCFRCHMHVEDVLHEKATTNGDLADTIDTSADQALD